MTEPRIKRVVIAGGGTSGWVAAAALVKQLGPLLEITLVESEEIGTIGVGESTIPTSRTFNQLLGIDEQAFMRATQSTFKLGISFENWGNIGDRYIHSFGENGPQSTWMASFHHFWMEARAQGFGGSLSQYCYELKAAEAERFATGEGAHINYAFHLDATLYARFLRNLAEPAGVRRVEGKIMHVERGGENGFISALVLESGARIEGDLFIDCTGFRGLLIEGALETGYEDWSHWLRTDTACAVQSEGVAPPVPYTRAIAHEAGWRWQIPLQYRVGNGIVFSSEHMSVDEASAKLLASLDGKPLFDPRPIRFRTGRRRKVWNGNCVAIGLSSGFIEPLESTAIHLVKIAVMRLIQNFPFAGISKGVVDRFNQYSREEIEGIRDFIILHYHITSRDDSAFWRDYRTMEVPESLQQRIDAFRDNAQAYQDGIDVFRVDSWVQVMLGQGLQPTGYHALAKMMPPAELKQALETLAGNIEKAVQQLPSHQTFLERYCPAAA